MSRDWYIYNGPDGFPSEGTVGNYSFIGFLPNCNGGTHLCAVYAVYGGNQPISLSSRLQGYFAPAKANHSFYPLGISDKPYVYTRA